MGDDVSDLDVIVLAINVFQAIALAWIADGPRRARAGRDRRG